MTMHSVPTRNYCTLFDQNYLIKGLTMIRSLARHCASFRLYVLCMDDVTHQILGALALPQLVLIRLEDFEDPDLLRVKQERSRAEYCWTCTPCILDYVLRLEPAIDLLTYLDADLMFFSSPEPIYDEVGADSVAIIEHRFSAGFEHYAVNGKYNVQWVTIRRDASGLETLGWWRDRCIEWCSAVSDGERMGDQKYLDCWTTRFSNVHVVANIGAGVAPWNFATYQFSSLSDDVFVDGTRVIFFHYHGYKMLDDGGFTPMPRVYIETAPIPYPVYEPYRTALWNALAEVRLQVPNFTCGIYTTSPLSSLTQLGDSAEPASGPAAGIRRRLRRLLGGGRATLRNKA